MVASAFVRMIYLQMPQKERLLYEIRKRWQNDEVSFDLFKGGNIVCKSIGQTEEISTFVVSKVQAE